MRKIMSKEDERKRQKRNQVIIGVLLVVLMLGSTFAIIVESFGNSNSNQKIIYNGQEFTMSNNYYILEIGEVSFYFLSNPTELNSLKREFNVSKTITNYIGSVLYLDSTDYYSSQDIYQNLNPYVERVQLACFDEENCQDSTLPVKTCEDNLIIIRESENNKVYEEENCIFIEGKKEDLIKLTDEFLFKLIGLR